MDRSNGRTRRSRVLIVGGGVAGLEAALALRDLAGDRVKVEMRAPRSEFVYRPFAVGEPYGASQVFRYDLRQLVGRCGVSFHLDSVVSVDRDRRLAITRDGEEVAYDYLLVASGARMLWAVPGAVTFWGVADEGGVEEVVRELRSGRLGRVLFTMPGGCNWALPVYELALLAATTLEKFEVGDTRLTVVTSEDAPLELFGRRAGEQMGRLLAEHDIEVIAGAHPVKFEDGRLQVAPGEPIEADVTIALPRLEARRIGGVPHDQDGFVPVDEHGRVPDMDRVFAAGDVTGFPVKQGGIATQQADAAAEAIAVEVGAQVEAQPFDPILRGVLWTGKEPWYLYGRLTGGHGETSTFSEAPPWPPHEGKIIGRYLTPFLESVDRAAA
jgi:sulfide:quinone oxidoreductase